MSDLPESAPSLWLAEYGDYRPEPALEGGLEVGAAVIGKIKAIDDLAVRRFRQTACALQGNIREQAHHHRLDGGTYGNGRNDRVHASAIRLRWRDQIIIVRSQECSTSDFLQIGDGLAHDASRRFARRRRSNSNTGSISRTRNTRPIKP